MNCGLRSNWGVKLIRPAIHPPNSSNAARNPTRLSIAFWHSPFFRCSEMHMSLPALDNLVRIGQLKAEPCNEAEVRRMLAMARVRLADAQLSILSPQGRFTSAYNAAHAAALAALRLEVSLARD